MTPNADFNRSLDQALNLARNARHVEVFTGAGMSAESGLETYRDDTTGLWENVDPQAMASMMVLGRFSDNDGSTNKSVAL